MISAQDESSLYENCFTYNYGIAYGKTLANDIAEDLNDNTVAIVIKTKLNNGE